MDVNSIFSDINQKFNIRDKNRITQFFIMTAAVLAADLSWAWLNKTFEGQKSWIWVITGISSFLILLSLNWLMMRASKMILAISFLVISISFLTIFDWRWEYILITAIAFVLFMIGSLRAIKEKNGRINIKCSKIFKLGLPLIITGVALMLSVAFYFSPSATSKKEIIIPRPIFNILIKPFIDQDLQNAPDDQAQDRPAGLIVLDPEILKKYNISLMEGASQQEIENAIYQLTNQQINQMAEPFRDFFPLGLTIGFFLIVKSVGHLLMYLVIFISWLIFRILVNIGAIKINVEPTVREVIEM